MDESIHSSSSSESSPFSSSDSTPAEGSAAVLSIECLKGGATAGEWSGAMLQTGDIVEEIRIGNTTVKSPFRNGKSAVQRILHASFKQKETSIHIKVRRGAGDFAELQACIVPAAAGGGHRLFGRKQYVLRAVDDPNYTVGFVDRTVSECLNLQASRTIEIVSTLERSLLHNGYVTYPWEQKMHEMLCIPNSNNFHSILFLPRASKGISFGYNDVEDTLARLHLWINASQESGVPIIFLSVQIESLLSKISGDTASATVSARSLSDLSNLASTSIYGFEDYHGVDIGVVRAVRLWYSPLAGEIPIEIKITDTDTKLGFAISRTEEGFIYISSVIQGTSDVPSTRSGLSSLHEQASQAFKLLVISRISNRKVLPWMISSKGAIRCFDTVSLSHKLSLHRHSRAPVTMHVFLWDQNARVAPAMPSTCLPSFGNEDRESGGGSSKSDSHEMMLDRDTAGEFSFYCHEFAVKDKWV